MPNFRAQIQLQACISRVSNFDFRCSKFVSRISNFAFRDSSLPLLVLRVLADHPHDTATAYDLALRTDLLNRRTNLHFFLAPLRRSSLETRSDFKSQTPDSRFRIQDYKIRFSSFNFRVSNFEFPVSIFEFRFSFFTCTGTRSGRASGRTEKARRRPYPREEFG